MVVCDKWVTVKVFELIFCISCVVCKRVTDDEAVRVSLFLQKISREWSLLRNVTWSSLGASFGDAVYGGYVIITFGLLLGRIFGEIPQGRRILEGFLLGMGALFFIVLGGLELASLDSIPENLIDNAAVLGVLSLVTAALFLIDLAGPRKNIHTERIQRDTEKNVFSYPTLPREDKNSIKIDSSITQSKKTTSQKVTKKTNKNESEIERKIEAPDIMGEKLKTKNALNGPLDETDTFIESEKSGYHKFADDHNEDVKSFEPIEKTKYGSVRNGAVRNSETEVFQKVPPGYVQNKQIIKDINDEYKEKTKRDEYQNEVQKNFEYLKMLETKGAMKTQLDGIRDTQDFNKFVDRYMNEYKQEILYQVENNRKYPRAEPNSHFKYERPRQWETFEEENLPPFPVKEDYLPELQTPVFARIKEGKSKGYGIYDNYSNYNIPMHKNEGSQTDTLKSKTSTLKSKPPTLQQIAEYFGLEQKKSNRLQKKEASSQVSKDELPTVSFVMPMMKLKNQNENYDCNGEPLSPIDPGYVQYTAQNWNDKHNRKHLTRTPRHSPTDD